MLFDEISSFSRLGAITPGFTQTMQLFDTLADLSEWFKLLVHFVQSIEKEKTRLFGQPGAKTKRIMHFWFLLIVRRQCHQCRCPEVSNVD